MFAASSGAVAASAPTLMAVALQTNGTLHFTFTNTIGAPFTVLGSADISLALDHWTALGPAIETTPGHFEFSDVAVNSRGLQFYRVRSP
jgi:hypothetical protein